MTLIQEGMNYTIHVCKKVTCGFPSDCEKSKFMYRKWVNRATLDPLTEPERYFILGLTEIHRHFLVIAVFPQ
jgi:hypothetical protein